MVWLDWLNKNYEAPRYTQVYNSSILMMMMILRIKANMNGWKAISRVIRKKES